jgi:hypothetical protein
VCVQVDERIMRDGRVDPALLQPIGRLGGSIYTRAAEGLFKMKRPTWEGVRASTEPPEG